MEQPTGFSEKGARRVAHAARREERFDRLRYNGSGPRPFRPDPKQRVGYVVKITGQPSLGDPELWPAVVVECDGYTGGAVDWSDGDECWVVRCNGDTGELATGTETTAEPVGVKDDDERLIFAVGRGGGGGGEYVWGETLLYNTVDLTGSHATVLETGFFPSAGLYHVTWTASAVLEGDADSFVVAFCEFAVGSGPSDLRWSSRPLVVCMVQADGRGTAGTAHFAVTIPLGTGLKARLRAAYSRPFSGANPTVAFVGGYSGFQYPGTTGNPDGFPSLPPVMMETRITWHKVAPVPASATVPPPPPPPAGAISGKATLDGDGLDGRNVTLSGATSGTTATAGGVYWFDPVNEGANTVTLSLLPGETCTYQVDGGGWTAGNAAPVTVAAGFMHDVRFEVAAASAGTIVVTITSGGVPEGGRTVTYSGGGTFVESPVGTHTLTGVTPGTGGTIAISGSWLGGWTCDNAAGSGSGVFATGVDVTAGGTTTVAYTTP